jgi:two-component system, OmpR family, KDP operon response regulator KdpE
MSGRVLVVDDEVEIRRALKTGLGHHGFEVEAVAGGGEALAAAAARTPDVVLLDLGLPDLDGFKVLTQLREKSRAAVIVLSVMADQRDKVRALDLGADDYLVKPFGLDELLARIRAVLRRQAAVASGDAVVRVGDLAIDLGRRLVTVAGKPVHLTPTEYELLRYLALHAGKLVTHTILLREVWGAYAVGESQNTRYVVAQIRRKLGDDPARPRFIATEPGVGYRLRVDPEPVGEHPNEIQTPG